MRNSHDLRSGNEVINRDAATGLDHTWFRKNEPQAGRWTSPDPYNGSMNIGDPQTVNRYVYVGSQPTNFIDPIGLFRERTQMDWGTWWFFMFGPEQTSFVHGDPATTPGGGGGGGEPDRPKCGDQLFLPAEKTDVGDMARLIFAEATELSSFARAFPPTSSGYQNAVNNYLGEMEMVGSIAINMRNLVNGRPNLRTGFGNRNGSVSDFIRSVGAVGTNFAGFLIEGISSGISGRIKNALNGSTGSSECRKLMDALLVASGLLTGTRNVRHGIFGMRTGGHGAPGGNYTLLQSLAGSGNAFFGLQPSFLNPGR